MCTPSLYPNDLEMLDRVLKQVCARERIDVHSEYAEDIGCRLVNLFQSGVQTEVALLDAAAAWRAEMNRMFG